MPGLDPDIASVVRAQRCARWAIRFALVLLPLSLIGLSVLGWSAWTAHHESRALIQALAVQTQALAQRLHERTP